LSWLDRQASMRKLVYISAFLIAAEVRLEESEMAMVMKAATPFGWCHRVTAH
jgi:hypothetical protein